MMLTWQQLVDATGAQVVGEVLGAAPGEGFGVSTDSRSLRAGEVFVAIRGAIHDGHDHVDEARAKGACAAVVEREVPGLTCLVVDDTVAAYGRIAAAHLALLRATGLIVVGVTGSSGKTTTKDMITAVLGRHMRVCAPTGSMNNDIGLPATVLAAGPDTQVLVLEMGMRGIGHIRRLCEVAPPDVAVVTNVGRAHIGELGTQEAIAQAKSEIVRYSAAGSTAVLNADDHRVRAMSTLAPGTVLLAGEAADAQVRASEVSMAHNGAARFVLTLPDGSRAEVALGVLGRHQVGNACIVAAVAYRLGLTADQIRDGLEQAEVLSRWRMEVHSTSAGITVVNDAYNANPDSVAAALRALAQLPCSGRRVAVLGEMLELGEHSQGEHEQVGALSSDLGIDLVIAVGDAGGWIAAGRGTRPSVRVPDSAAALAHVRGCLASGDVVLVKASRSVGLERVGIVLVDEFGTVSA